MYGNVGKSCRKYSSNKQKNPAIFQGPTGRAYSLLRDLLLRKGIHELMSCWGSLPIFALP
jgi:hypothetical protein